jgi:hypothetical protein
MLYAWDYAPIRIISLPEPQDLLSKALLENETTVR